MGNKIIVISGFSSAGKDKICKYIADNLNYKMVISTTSRTMRPEESENNPYHFVTKNKFEDMICENEFIEFRKYDTLVNNVPDTWYYGTNRNSIDLKEKSYVDVLDMLGLIDFKKHYKKDVISFFIDVNEQERKRRAILSRKDFDLTEWNRRYLDDIKQFPMKIVRKEVDYIVENYNFLDCIEKIVRLI